MVAYPKMNLSLVSVLFLGTIFGELLPVTLASSSSSTTSTSTITSPHHIAEVASRNKDVPKFVQIHNDQNTMIQMLELARQRHVKDIQKAKESYNCCYTSEEAAKAVAQAQGTNGNGNGGQSSTLLYSSNHNIKWDEYTIVTSSTPNDENENESSNSISSNTMPDFASILERNLFVSSKETPLFTKDECQELINRCENHYQHNNGQWGMLKSGRYPVCGFWINSIPTVHKWFNEMVKKRLFPILYEKFPNFVDSLDDLVVDNAYVFKYTPETGRRTDVHTDSGCLSFTICFNGGNESDIQFEGGGTWFQGLQSKRKQQTDTTPSTTSGIGDGDVIEMSMGQCTVRPGGVRHYGCAVTSGTRYIIGGFCMNSKRIEYVRMLQNVGNDFLTQKNYQMAAKVFETAIAVNPNTDGPYSHYAQALKELGQDDKAQVVLEHCLQHVNPSSGEVAYTLGTLYMKQQLHEKVQECMKICLQDDENDVDAMMCMSQACSGLNDEKGEIEWYERIAFTSVPVDVTIQSQAYCNLGVLAVGTVKEIEHYQKSIQLTPKAFPPHYSLASAYASHKKWNLALKWFHKALQVAKSNTDEEIKTLRMMYQVIMSKLQQEQEQNNFSQQDMMKEFMKLMGKENYEKLSMILKQQSK